MHCLHGPCFLLCASEQKSARARRNVPCRMLRSRTHALAPRVLAVALLFAAFAASGEEPGKAANVEADITAAVPAPRKSVVLPRRVGQVDVGEAARRLERARLARRQGLEPRPGEFVQAGGVRTMNYRYWKRQEKLRVAVEEAQRRSQAANRILTRTQPKASQI